MIYPQVLALLKFDGVAGSVISYIIVDAIVSKGGHKMDLSIIDNSLIVSTASGVQFYRLNK